MRKKKFLCEKGDLEVVDISWHRNGISGVGFYAILFKNKDERNELFVAALYDAPGYCSVLRVADLSDPTKGVRFGINSWRGDYYEPELRRLAAAWGETNRIGPFSAIPF